MQRTLCPVNDCSYAYNTKYCQKRSRQTKKEKEKKKKKEKEKKKQKKVA